MIRGDTVLLNKFIEDITEGYRKITEKDLPKIFIAKIKKVFTKKLYGNTNYNSYEILNSTLKKFVQAQLNLNPYTGKNRVLCNMFYFNKEEMTKSNIKKELTQINNFYKFKYEITIPINTSNKKILKLMKEINAVEIGNNFVGNVDKGLEILKSTAKKLPEGFSIKLMNYRRDIDKVLSVDKISQKREESSVATTYTAYHRDEMRKYFLQMCKSKSSFSLYYHNKIIGVAAILYNFKYKRVGHIGTIAIIPQYQGRGLSYNLYQTMLNDMKMRKVKMYTGHTTTHKVLKISKRLKRENILKTFFTTIIS
ncbi:MAG: GNAT family N-acetyltransferase [Oligoflexia bacterium]|nr:GNAT family N-acetyltransferase [Oligoflexia bacterium]